MIKFYSLTHIYIDCRFVNWCLIIKHRYHNTLNVSQYGILSDTCNNNFGTNCFSFLPPIYNLRKSFDVGDCTEFV